MPDAQPPTVLEELGEAQRLLQENRPAEADAICRRVLRAHPHEAQALHLLGLVEKARGNDAQSERYLRASVALAPQRADFHSSLGHLLRRTGRLAGAVESYRASLACAENRAVRMALARTLLDLGKPQEAARHTRKLTRTHASDPSAWLAHAAAMRALRRTRETEDCYRTAISLAPQDAVPRHNLAAFLSEQERAEEAAACLDKAAALGACGIEYLLNRGRVYMQLYELDRAEEAFRQAVELDPAHTRAQSNLAHLRYMRGDRAFGRDLQSAVRRVRAGSPLQLLHAQVLHRTGESIRAEEYLRRQIDAYDPEPGHAFVAVQMRALLAAILHERGELPQALEVSRAALQLAPADERAAQVHIEVLLAMGLASEALRHIRRQQRRRSDDQRLLAYEATALRIMGDALYQDLHDYARLVRVFEVRAPAGWSSIAELDGAVTQALERLHRLVGRPLDRSLRNGSRTVRNLLAERDDSIRALLSAFAGPIREYCELLGYSRGHPLSRRNRGNATIASCWSVRLRCGGMQLSHVHRRGWLSSAYYVRLPGEVPHEWGPTGWLRFGEPGFPGTRLGADHAVQPVAGALVLFPSYMWHGTCPIADAQPRLSVAFDAAPASGP